MPQEVYTEQEFRHEWSRQWDDRPCPEGEYLRALIKHLNDFPSWATNKAPMPKHISIPVKTSAGYVNLYLERKR